MEGRQTRVYAYLSTSACTPTSLNESHDTWQYGEESDVTARLKDPGINFPSEKPSQQKKGLSSKFQQLVQRAKNNTSSPRKPSSPVDINVNMVSILHLADSLYVPVQPLYKAKLRHDVPGDPELGQYAELLRMNPSIMNQLINRGANQ